MYTVESGEMRKTWAILAARRERRLEREAETRESHVRM
jgi:hypothetical protein